MVTQLQQEHPDRHYPQQRALLHPLQRGQERHPTIPRHHALWPRQSRRETLAAVHRVARTTLHETRSAYALRVFLCLQQRTEKTHEKAHQIAQFCVVAPIFPASRVHGPRCTGQGSRCCRLPAVTMCARFENVCTNWPQSVHTNNSLYFNGLQKCVHELHALHALSGFVFKSIVFLKKFKIEISSKKPCTQCTHCYSPYVPTV